MSADGAVVVGRCSVADSEIRTRRWEAGVYEDLGFLAGAVSARTEAAAISDDGSTIVGRASGPDGLEPFRWRADTGLVGLGQLPGTTLSGGYATAVDADGSVVVGGSFPLASAWRWEDGVMESQGHGHAVAVSADGSVAVGIAGPADPGWRWTAAEGRVALGVRESRPRAVTADGRLVVGEAELSAGRVASIWDETFGMRALRAVLEGEFGFDTSEWQTIDSAVAVSPDGRMLAGSGTRVGVGVPEVWLALLPHPPGRFGCDVEMSAERYAVGEPVVLSRLRFGNLDAAPFAARLKVQLEVLYGPGLVVTVVDTGHSLPFALPAAAVHDVGPVTMLTARSEHTNESGAHRIRCALEDRATGRVLAEDFADFAIADAPGATDERARPPR